MRIHLGPRRIVGRALRDLSTIPGRRNNGRQSLVAFASTPLPRSGRGRSHQYFEDGEMKSARNVKPRQTEVSIIRRDGRIVLPPSLANFKLGQRVYFHWNGREVAFASKPKRALRGRLISRRIRPGVRTPRLYGPRA